MTLDVSKDAGRDLFIRLIAEADVLIENNLPSAMREQGLDYASLEQINPQLVMVSITPLWPDRPVS